jgi:hypothetical protein
MILDLSYSTSADDRACHKKFYYRNVLGLKPRKKSFPQTIGSTIHVCWERYFLGNDDEASLRDYIVKTYSDAIAECNDPNIQERLLIDKYTCLGMWENYPFHELSFKQVLPEHTYTYQLGKMRGVYYQVKVDALIQDTAGKWWIREVKTTASDKKEREQRASKSYQITGGVYAILKETGLKVSGAFYDFMRKPLLRKGVHETATDFGERIYRDYASTKKDPLRKDFYYSKYMSYRTTAELAEFEKDMISQAIDIRRRLRLQDWPRNTDACFKYKSECPFMRICWEENPAKELIDSLYEQGGDGVKFICPKCGFDRWKTVVKHEVYKCRKCGHRVKKQEEGRTDEQEA